MTFKIVKSASVEVVTISELRIGDSVLWGRLKATIKHIDYQNHIITTALPIGELGRAYAYYRIIDCIEERPKATCPGCGAIIESLTDYPDEFCSTRCKDNFDEAYSKGEIYG